MFIAATLPPGTVCRVFITKRKCKVIDNANPKDAIGSAKIPMHLWPITATIYGVMGLLAGKHKYGRLNWRGSPVRASIYIDALVRHANAWMEGEELDPDDGTPHLGNALACLAIIIDAKCCGTLVDDRQYNGKGFRIAMAEMTPLVTQLAEKYKDKNPKHWTIADNNVVCSTPLPVPSITGVRYALNDNLVGPHVTVKEPK